MLLGRIKEDVIKFADVISKTLDVDVLIVDSDLQTVGNTFRYFDKFTDIKRLSIIGQVITTGQVVTIDDKRKFSVCKVCQDYGECEMSGFIGVPILYRDCVVGAIALILPQQRIARIFKDVNNSIDFLVSMADLLSCKLQNSDDYSALNFIKQEREILMDSITDAIVSTDNMGYISYYNKSFFKKFCKNNNGVGIALNEIIPHKLIAHCLETHANMKNKLIFVDEKEIWFYGLMSADSITVNGRYTGMLFTLKPVSHVNSEFSGISGIREICFSRYEQRLFLPGLAEEGKRLAVTDKTILIQCAPNMGDDILAECIHRFSDRGKAAFLTVDCSLVYDLLEQSIFGELGKLHLTHGGTVLFRNIELLPLYLQQRLVEFMKTHRLVHQGRQGVAVDVRLLFSTSEDLKKLVDRGVFFDELYYRIAENTLILPPLCQDRSHLQRIILDNIKHFKQQYQKTGLVFDETVLEMLYRYEWPGNLVQLTGVIDRLTQKCSQIVTQADLAFYIPELSQTKQENTIEDLEKQRIRELLETDLSKYEVARILGIGRATLYRKIKLYQL